MNSATAMNQAHATCAIEAPHSQVESDIRALDRSLDCISDSIAILTARLQPVLPPTSPEVDKAPSNEGDGPVRCDFARKLYHMNRGAERINAQLATLINTLQV